MLSGISFQISQNGVTGIKVVLRFVREETFCGPLSGLAKRKLITSYQCRYNLHNEKIKAIAESKR